MTDENQTNRPHEPTDRKRVKEYGKKISAPLLDVFLKYQDEFTPFLEALAEGLEAGAMRLRKEQLTEPQKYVSTLLEEASVGIREAGRRLQTRDVSELSRFLSTLAEKNPSLMFGISYGAGIFIGRLSRHLITERTARATRVKKETAPGEPPTFNRSIH